MSRARELRLSKLELLQAEGYLDESDTEEVAGTLELLANKYTEGAITEHFAVHVIEKLANDVRPKYLPRVWEEWGVCIDVEGEMRER